MSKLFLAALSLHLTNPHYVRISLWSGMLIGNVFTLATAYAFYVKHAQ